MDPLRNVDYKYGLFDKLHNCIRIVLLLCLNGLLDKRGVLLHNSVVHGN